MMKFKNLLFLLVMSLTVIGTPALASGGGDDHAEQSQQLHFSDLNWVDFSNKDAPPLVALLVNLAGLIFIVYLLLRKGLTKRFKNRKETLENEIAEAREMKEAAESALKEARAKMDALDAEMEKIKKDIFEAGQSESKKVVEDAKAMGERLSADAMAMVEQEVARLTQSIREEAVEEIIALARELVQEKMDAADRDRMITQYLTGLTADTNAVAAQDGEAS